MVLSQQEKRQKLKREKELEEYEAEMLSRYTVQQETRAGDIHAKKAEAEAIRDQIFRKLEEEECARRG
jgi:hypothetical protein